MFSPDRVLHARQLLEKVVDRLPERIEAFTVLTETAPDELRMVFIDHLDAALPEIKASAQCLNYPELQRHAHNIKGIGGAVGFPEISALGEYIEERCRDKQAEPCRASVEALTQWLATLEKSP